MTADVKKSLVIGYGSIGRRHEAVLKKMGAETAIVSKHAVDLPFPIYSTVRRAIEEFSPDYIVVSNRTSEHMETLEEIQTAGFSGTCLVEKPLSEKPVVQEYGNGFDTYVGYVMRFHPLIRQAASILEGKRLLSIQSYVGQYLPDWRPGTDYRECYSASKEQGGGVIRDLSHELDYIALLAGIWKRVSALGGHLSDLEIESDDLYGLLMEMDNCPVVLCQMNYLDRSLRRDCTIQYESGTIHLDFIGNQLVHNGATEKFELERNEMIEAMHAAAWALNSQEMCSLDEAMQTLELIEAAEKSSREGCWVCRTIQ